MNIYPEVFARKINKIKVLYALGADAFCGSFLTCQMYKFNVNYNRLLEDDHQKEMLKDMIINL